MGVNLVPIVRDFSIHTETFGSSSHDIADGCVTAGTHRVMRFDFLTWNKGNADLDVGAPSDHPEWFVLSQSHGHYHLIDFNQFRLYDSSGNPTATGAKQAFCLEDSERIDPAAATTRRFTDCNANQGVQAGWADLYYKTLPCQYIVIDGLPDGDYTLLSTTNAKKLFPEDTYDDNTVCTGLHIAGYSVSEIDPPIGRQLLTPSLNFNDVPAGETTARAVTVEIKTCRSVTIRFQAGPTVGPGSAAGTVFDRLGATGRLATADEWNRRSRASPVGILQGNERQRQRKRLRHRVVRRNRGRVGGANRGEYDCSPNGGMRDGARPVREHAVELRPRFSGTAAPHRRTQVRGTRVHRRNPGEERHRDRGVRS